MDDDIKKEGDRLIQGALAIAKRENVDPLREEAAKMKCYEFAEAYDAPMRLWGKPIPRYACVTVGKLEFLWNLKDGSFDGWNRSIQNEDHV